MKNNNLPYFEQNAFGKWIPREVVKEFFGYKETKMCFFSREYNIRKSKVGRKVFYHYDDIIELLKSKIEEEVYYYM